MVGMEGVNVVQNASVAQCEFHSFDNVHPGHREDKSSGFKKTRVPEIHHACKPFPGGHISKVHIFQLRHLL
jgi:hypothetical protein